jgi:hypothetical protein
VRVEILKQNVEKIFLRIYLAASLRLCKKKKSTVWHSVFFNGNQRYGLPAPSLKAMHIIIIIIIIINFEIGKRECYLLFLCQQQYQNKLLLVQRQALFRITCCQGEKVEFLKSLFVFPKSNFSLINLQQSSNLGRRR